MSIISKYSLHTILSVISKYSLHSVLSMISKNSLHTVLTMIIKYTLYCLLLANTVYILYCLWLAKTVYILYCLWLAKTGYKLHRLWLAKTVYVLYFLCVYARQESFESCKCEGWSTLDFWLQIYGALPQRRKNGYIFHKIEKESKTSGKLSYECWIKIGKKINTIIRNYEKWMRGDF